MAVGQVPPEKTAFFFELARKVAADLVATPISEDELQRTVGPLAQYVLRASTGNQFWMQQLGGATRSEEHTSELQSPMRISYAVFCFKKKKHTPVSHSRLSNHNN